MSKSGELRKVYAVRLESSLANAAIKKAGSLTRAVEEALREWLDKGLKK